MGGEQPAEALGWWASRNPGSGDTAGEESEAVNGAMGAWVRRDSAAAIAWWERLPESESRTQLGNIIALNEGNLDLALQQFRPVPGQGSEAAAERIASVWIERDANAAAQWIESLPKGALRDRATQGYVSAAAKADPAIAAEWTCAIADPYVRMQTARSVAQALAMKDPQAARLWVQSLPGIEERHRDALLRSFR
jgi:hypothetical protein